MHAFIMALQARMYDGIAGVLNHINDGSQRSESLEVCHMGEKVCKCECVCVCACVACTTAVRTLLQLKWRALHGSCLISSPQAHLKVPTCTAQGRGVCRGCGSRFAYHHLVVGWGEGWCGRVGYTAGRCGVVWLVWAGAVWCSVVWAGVVWAGAVW